jgi:Dihaem cytochrome c.
MIMKEQKQGLFSDFHFSAIKVNLILLFFLAACSSKLMTSTAIDLQKMQEKVPSMTLEKANKGRTLYVQHCSSCHHLYDPGKFTETEWSAIMVKMIPKSKINDLTDQQLVTDYLRSLSK